MSKEVLVFLLGIVLTITPYLGIPASLKETIILTTGVFLIFLGYTLRRAAFLRRIRDQDGDHTTDSFVENTHEQCDD